jgi:hypothetical protein
MAHKTNRDLLFSAQIFEKCPPACAERRSSIWDLLRLFIKFFPQSPSIRSFKSAKSFFLRKTAKGFPSLSE